MWSLGAGGRAGGGGGELPRPKPRYVQILGRMNPGSHVIDIPFNGRDIFPRDKSIRLELLEFSVCSEADHREQHFAGEQRDAFPVPEEYRPTILVRRPVPLPVVKRRRTVFYVPSMGAELMPGAAAPKTPTGREEGAAEDDDDDDDDDLWARLFEGQDDNWDYAPDEYEELEGRRRHRFKRAAFADAKVTVEARFSKWLHSRSVKCYPPSTTFLGFLEKVQNSLTAIWQTEFCGLLKHGPPTFQTEEISRSRVRVILRMPPSAWLAFSNSGIFKMLGFDLDERPFHSTRRLGGSPAQTLRVVRTREETAVVVLRAKEEINPNGYLTTARGMTEELDRALQEFQVSMGVDAHVQSFSWQLDEPNLICRPGDSPVVPTSLHCLNRLISLALEVLLLHDSQGTFRADVADEGALAFPNSGGLQAAPVDNHSDSYFRISVVFGGEAAQALGLRPHISPIQLSSGKKTGPTGPQAFLRFDKRPEFDQEADGGGLTSEELSQFVSWLLVDSCVDNTNNSILAVDSIRRLNETLLERIKFPSWSPRRPPPPPPPPAQTQPEREPDPPPAPVQTAVEESEPEPAQPQPQREPEPAQPAQTGVEDPEPEPEPTEDAGASEAAPEDPLFTNVDKEEEAFLNFADEKEDQGKAERKEVYNDYNDPDGGSGDPANYAGTTFWAKHLNWYHQQRALFVKAWRLNQDHHNYFWPDEFKQLFSAWILKRHNNRPNFEALFPPPTDPDHPDSRPAEEEDPELPVYIQEYESPAGGGGEATDYPGDTSAAKSASWQRHQEQIFSRRWQLPPNYRKYEWASEYLQEFKKWIAGRIKNRPKFADQAPSAAAAAGSAISEEDLADYQDPDGGGGRPEDYEGSTPWQRNATWLRIQTELFARRWQLRVDEQRYWPKDFALEFSKWMSNRMSNKPSFYSSFRSGDLPKSWTLDEAALTRADLDLRGRSLRTSGYIQIFEEEEELARPMTADELPAPRQPVHRSVTTDDPYEERSRLPDRPGETFGDELEQRIMADPWEWIEIPNPQPRPPTTYPLWASWPAPTCPPTKPSPPHPLPATFSLLCPDGERRDFFGPFGMDSFLAKIRLGHGVAFQNFCIIRNPGQRPGLKFEVVDLGYNKFAYAGAGADGEAPLLLKLAFRFYTLASDDDLVSYIC